jgi:glycosyltransferase involved in cell wall biosynthesis
MSAAEAAGPPSGVVAVIPAFNEEVRIAATIGSLRTVRDVEAVVVADDGSRDQTARLAADAGAHVVGGNRRRGKAAAMTAGAAAAADLHRLLPLLFVDADLEESAANLGPLIEPVVAGAADLTIAVLPAAVGAGGHGFVKRLATAGIVQATGWHPTAPLSGQRCITRPLFEAVLPLAAGFGVETGMTIDALRAGAGVSEVSVDLCHRVTGHGLSDQWHRARQYRDVWRALAARKVYRLR